MAGFPSFPWLRDNPFVLILRVFPENVRLALHPHQGHTDANLPWHMVRVARTGGTRAWRLTRVCGEHTVPVSLNISASTLLRSPAPLPLPHICPLYRHSSGHVAQDWGVCVGLDLPEHRLFTRRRELRAAQGFCSVFNGLRREGLPEGCRGGRGAPTQKGSHGPTPALKAVLACGGQSHPSRQRPLEPWGSGVTLTSGPWLPPAWPVTSAVCLLSLRLSFPICQARRPRCN